MYRLNLFKLFREYILKRRILSLGINTTLYNVKISSPHKFTIGNHSLIGESSFINAMGGVSVGSNVITGPRVVIWSVNHNFENAQYLPYDSNIINKKVKIEDNVWIGEGVKLSPGVVIGEGAIIAMGSVVSKNIPPLAIAGGNPAKVIRFREDIEHYKLLSKFSEENSYLRNKKYNS